MRLWGTDPGNKLLLAGAGAWTIWERVTDGSSSDLQGFSEDFPVKTTFLCKGLHELQRCNACARPRGTEMAFCFLNRLICNNEVVPQSTYYGQQGFM